MRKLILPLVFLALISTFSLLTPSNTLATWTKSSSNPVISNSPSGWDSYHAADPTVIKDGDTYKIWYTGTDSSAWTNSYIGYAESSNGITWTKYINNPLSFGNNAEQPTVIKDGSVYKMWYNIRINNGQSFEIKYATSSDGTSWNIYPSSVIVPYANWNNKGVGAPSVIKLGNTYYMWFVGGSGSIWQTGFATSTDGINWDKNADPVLAYDPNYSWENGATSPMAIYDGGIYELWYTGEAGIGHAWSNDGINWFRDPENPVLDKGQNQDFDNHRVASNTVMRESGMDKTWYTGMLNSVSGKFQIGYAEKETEGVPITPLPPTPTPKPNKVIFIPGLGASWNRNDLLSCNLSQSNTWIMAPYTDIYDRIIQTLSQNAGLVLNEEFYVYAYDWRQTMETAGQKLKEFIDNIQPNGKVDIVSHSLGGLVARSYILQNGEDHNVDKLVTMGTPHQGTVLAYPLLVDKIAVNTLINFCRTRLGNPFETKRQVIQSLSPSIRDILPTFNFIKWNGQLMEDDLIEGENPWLRDNQFSLPFYDISVLTISGIEKKTLEYLEVKKPSAMDNLLGNWVDGKPTKKINSDLGDGTVLTSSSQLEDANSFTFNLNHIQLVQNTQSIQEILNFLGLEGVSVADEKRLPELTTQSLFSITSNKPGKFILKTLKREVLETDSSGIITYYSDKSGKFSLEFTPSEDGDYIISYNQLGKSEAWKEYKFTLQVNKVLKLIVNYNPKKASVNPLVRI
ncbi:hypothetical protein HYW54_01480 [Candidatus Gottesmanbacteria bacterium]|nr:hypothetical protein [Candidatus Gottesmanbacteria bacterium]